jgi:hypothetical protein
VGDGAADSVVSKVEVCDTSTEVLEDTTTGEVAVLTSVSEGRND